MFLRILDFSGSFFSKLCSSVKGRRHVGSETAWALCIFELASTFDACPPRARSPRTGHLSSSHRALRHGIATPDRVRAAAVSWISCSRARTCRATRCWVGLRSTPRVAEVAAELNGPCRILAVHRWSPDRIADVSFSGGETTVSSPASSFHSPLSLSLSRSLRFRLPRGVERVRAGDELGNLVSVICSLALLIFLSRSPLPVALIHPRCGCFCCCQIHFFYRLSFFMGFSSDLFFCNISGGIWLWLV